MKQKAGTGKGFRINHGYKQITHRGIDLWKYEHVLVMEKSIGRRLLPGEVVHHINGKKLDNRLDNLRLMNTTSHMQLHAATRSPEYFARLLPKLANRPRSSKTGRFLPL